MTHIEDLLESLPRERSECFWHHQGAMLVASTCGGHFACDKPAVIITTETKK